MLFSVKIVFFMVVLGGTPSCWSFYLPGLAPVSYCEKGKGDQGCKVGNNTQKEKKYYTIKHQMNDSFLSKFYPVELTSISALVHCLLKCLLKEPFSNIFSRFPCFKFAFSLPQWLMLI